MSARIFPFQRKIVLWLQSVTVSQRSSKHYLAPAAVRAQATTICALLAKKGSGKLLQKTRLKNDFGIFLYTQFRFALNMTLKMST